MKLSVIIPCFNAADTIGCQLEALANQSWSEPWEVIISDNGCTDESRKIVEHFKNRVPNLRIVDSSDRRWRAHACNVGVERAAGDSVAFCDADDEVCPGWVAAMGMALARHDFVACRIEFEKLNPPWIAETFKHHRQRRGLQKVPYPPYLHHGGGGTLGVKRSLHQAVGGFDTSLPRLQDTDYCFRVQRAGIELHFVPDAVIHIRCRQDLRGTFHQARLWAKYNVLMYKRYRPPGTMELWRWRKFVREGLHVVLSARHLMSMAQRSVWVSKLGWQIGLLEGSLQFKVPPI